ncbi:MAG: PilZ domain-containing protein [Candidatus Omnitrophica bacterium]|nr:PilZ domain-containing protein [Candidatus Omnitrophota bacterium]
MIERRRYRRIKDGVRVIFKILHKKGEVELDAINVGSGGICVPLGEKVNPDTLIEIGLILPGEKKPFYVFAKVRWQAKLPKRDERGNLYFSTGVMFLKMSREERRKLIQYIYRSPEGEK